MAERQRAETGRVERPKTAEETADETGRPAAESGRPDEWDAISTFARQLISGSDEELRPQADWLQALIDHVSDYIYIKDKASRFVIANRQVALDIGYPDGADLVGKTDYQLHAEPIAAKFHADEQRVVETGIPQIDYEEFVITADKRKKWFASSKYPVRCETGEIVGIIGISRDITERQRAKLLQQGQNAVLRDIATGAQLKDVLNSLVLVMEEQLDGVMGSVMLLDDAGQRIFCAAAPNLPADYTTAVVGAEIGPKAGSCGTAVHTQRDVFVADIFASDLWVDYVEIMKQFDMRSCWSVPFFSSDGEVLGTFGLYTGQVREPTPFERRIAREAAQLASIAVERDRAERRIRYLAQHDALTGLPNRQNFNATLEAKIVQSGDSGAPVAVVFIDLDNFKLVNDTYGHAIGDRVLQIVADRIRRVQGPGQKAVRFGGDEFVVIADGAAGEEATLKSFMAAVRDEIVRKIDFGDMVFDVTCSIGAAVYPQHGATADDILKNADSAMFEAKRLGRDNFVLFDAGRTGVCAGRLGLAEEIRAAIEAEAFFLEYQPQFDLLSGRIVGAEALVRWRHPDRGRLMPGDFLAVAEETGLIVPLGRWILAEACRQNKAWQEAGLPAITVAVNVSHRQVQDGSFAGDVRHALDTAGLKAGHLELEFTEDLLTGIASEGDALLAEFRQMGVKLAVEDFGTGRAGLVMLRSLPLTRLKIDQGFMRDLDTRESGRAIVRAIISLGRELGLNVVAEGVETAKQQAFLVSCQCETTQGFHFGRPMPSDKFSRLLAMTRPQLDVGRA